MNFKPDPPLEIEPPTEQELEALRQLAIDLRGNNSVEAQRDAYRQLLIRFVCEEDCQDPSEIALLEAIEQPLNDRSDRESVLKHGLPAVLVNIHHNGQKLEFQPPLKLETKDEDGFYTAENEYLGLLSSARNSVQLIREIATEVAFLWDTYVLAVKDPEAELASDAIALRQKLLAITTVTPLPNVGAVYTFTWCNAS